MARSLLRSFGRKERDLLFCLTGEDHIRKTGHPSPEGRAGLKVDSSWLILNSGFHRPPTTDHRKTGPHQNPVRIMNTPQSEKTCKINSFPFKLSSQP